MPAVINVGGPLAWGLIVLASAWALRAGRALAGRRRARCKELDDDALLHRLSGHQPQYLQQLSATAVRMLVETGALPCFVLELADRGGSNDSRKKGPASSSEVAAAVAASSATQQPTTCPATAAATRIVPPDLAAAVPCMPVAAWLRALTGPEAWRTELTRTATAAATIAAATATARVTAGGGGASPLLTSSSLRSSYTSSHASSLLGRDGAAAAGGAGTYTVQQARFVSQSARLSQAISSANSIGGSGAGSLGSQPDPQEVQHGQHSRGASAAPQQQHAAQPSEGVQGSGSGSTACTVSQLPTDVDELHLQPQLQLQLRQRSQSSEPWVSPLASAGEPHDGRGGLDRWRGGSTGSAATAAATSPPAASASLWPYPPRHALLVVLGRSERSVAAVTAAAAAAGFSRVGVWVGSAESFAATSLGGPRLPSISRHGLWLMLQLGPEPVFHVPSLVLDVRRPDERLLYGAIRGTTNIPADELAAALALPALEFRRRYGVPLPGPWDVVVVHSRSGRRAAWAAQVCLDAGLQRVLVYNEGVCGWRLEDRVKPYRAYDMGAPPPDPESFTPEEPDEATGFEELHDRGLPMRQGPRPSRFSAVGLLDGGTAAAVGPGPATALGAVADASAATRHAAAEAMPAAAAPTAIASAFGGTVFT